jgi:hypothetical protein
MLSNHDRPHTMSGPLRIPSLTVLNLCEYYELTDEDFHHIMLIESIMYPVIIDTIKNQKELSEGE